jgi:hypothetical protein
MTCFCHADGPILTKFQIHILQVNLLLQNISLPALRDIMATKLAGEMMTTIIAPQENGDPELVC